MARALYLNGWDALCWNFRGCSGEPNRLLRSYHSGLTEDLERVIQHAEALKKYETIALVGFSLGGNLILKYLGDLSENVNTSLCGAITFSVPCDLEASSRKLSLESNRIYMIRFMRSLRRKIKEKSAMFPGKLDTTNLYRMKTFLEFDDKYTAPLNGFRDAVDYWTQCSCLSVLKDIRLPAVIINAANDPFLSEECFPIEANRENRFVHMEVPSQGGHVGFPGDLGRGMNWAELKATSFLENLS